MFYCDPCREKNDWPRTAFTSRGECEMCGRRGVCHDMPSSLLPARPTEQPVPSPPAHVEPSMALALTLVELTTLDVRLESIREERGRLAAILEDAAEAYYGEQLIAENALGLKHGIADVKCCTAATFRWAAQYGSNLGFDTTCTYDGDNMGKDLLVPLAWMNEYLTRPNIRQEVTSG